MKTEKKKKSMSVLVNSDNNTLIRTSLPGGTLQSQLYSVNRIIRYSGNINSLPGTLQYWECSKKPGGKYSYPHGYYILGG